MSPVEAPVVVKTWPNTIENGAMEGGESVAAYEFFETEVLMQFPQCELVALPHSQSLAMKEEGGVELMSILRILSSRSACRDAKSSFMSGSMGLNMGYGAVCGGDDEDSSRGMSGFSLSASYDSD